MRKRHALALFCLAFLPASCSNDAQSGTAQPTELGACAFERDIYPLLMRDCSFQACHGNGERFFQVFGAGRHRLDAATPILDAYTPAELQASYDRARSMLAGFVDAEDAWLLRKPLDAAVGGSSHLGTDAYKRNVYRSRDDAAWRALLAWARGESAACP